MSDERTNEGLWRDICNVIPDWHCSATDCEECVVLALRHRADESERASRRASWLRSDMLDVIAENDSLRERIKALEAVTEQAHIVARIYGETLCQGNEGREFLDALGELLGFDKEAEE